LRIGSIALEEFISGLPKNSRKQKFNEIKNMMLNPSHVTSTQKNITALFTEPAIKNTYPFKLVSGKPNHQGTDTIITYTILGKREGHQKNLGDLINNMELIEKFHPTETVKFGFIGLGDFLFSSLRS
jgi:hypothetical protein